MIKFLSFIVLCLTLSGCYPMPKEDDYSVVPMINNRDFNKEGENPLLPNASTF